MIWHDSAFDAADPPDPASEALTVLAPQRQVGQPDDLLPVLKPAPDLVDLLIAGTEDGLELVRGKATPRFLARALGRKWVVGNIKIGREHPWPIALAQ